MLKIFENNIKSQFGEDGVISEIFKRLGTKNKICVEFGAWDGEHFSNTWNLWNNQEWSAYLIEGDKGKIGDLIKNTKQFPKVFPINRYIVPEGIDSLDSILGEYPSIPRNFDLLSIDIDSDDYQIFKALNNYRPRLIIIEYNPTIPPHLDVVQVEKEYFGSSALAIDRLASEKGYSLVHMTDTNMFFIEKKELDTMNIKEVKMEEIFPKQHLTYVITSYDGRTLLSQVPVYHSLKAEGSITKFLRKFGFKNNKFKHIEYQSKTQLKQISVVEIKK
ncbi:FkbM family methyltransferase [Agrobacterium tumefaciens]|nr:FkbM family methyltransferase [Agrobacterium tumefaciens]NTE18911.1 FkbM family methyltransferase [Agrobacterium tumefaciens]